MSALLADLATRINAAHAAAEKDAASAVEHARQAGLLLLQAKKVCAHGDWLGWLEKNVTVTARMAQNYMRLSRQMGKLDESNTKRVSHLPLRDAIHAVAKGSARLAAVPAAVRERVFKEVEAGKNSYHAIAEQRETARREILQRPVANPIREVTECLDMWSTARRLIESSAKGMQQTISAESYHLKMVTKNAEALLPCLPEHLGEFIPQDVFGEMRSLRGAMRKELRKRVKDLVDWAAGQHVLIALLLLEAAEGAADEPILVGRRTQYSDNCQATQADVRMMGVACEYIPHAVDGCRCNNQPPLWCSRAAEIPRGSHCLDCDALLTFRNYCGEGDLCNACAPKTAAA